MWEQGVARLFRSQAAFWGWDDVYFGELLKGKIKEGVLVFNNYLGEGNPLIKHVEEASRAVLLQVNTCIAANNPALRPAERDLHHFTPVRVLSKNKICLYHLDTSQHPLLVRLVVYTQANPSITLVHNETLWLIQSLSCLCLSMAQSQVRMIASIVYHSPQLIFTV